MRPRVDIRCHDTFDDPRRRYVLALPLLLPSIFTERFLFSFVIVILLVSFAFVFTFMFPYVHRFITLFTF